MKGVSRLPDAKELGLYTVLTIAAMIVFYGLSLLFDKVIIPATSIEKCGCAVPCYSLQLPPTLELISNLTFFFILVVFAFGVISYSRCQFR